ncbi:SDR family NAD(P)-dependent oxidoreductase [Streptomyces sp. NPDC002018]|uniref:SDR family NAD(P)-dependent oxidoreductase n=1 Tax=Streptomyces sp. NPDC002018 TaxID=3364629 RepID=UPI0036C4EA3F
MTSTQTDTRQSGLTDAVLLVTGGTSGIGFATVRHLLKSGARVVVTGRSEERLTTAREQLKDVSDGGSRLLPVRADAADLPGTDALMEEIGERYGRLDGLFANAGSGIFRTIHDTEEDDFDKLVAVNFKGAFFTVKKALPLLRQAGGGSVVLTASWTLHRGMFPAAVYAATKAAVHNLARSLGTDLAHEGIRVNSVSPGYIRTPMYDTFVPSEAGREATAAAVPAGHNGTPEDIAHAVGFLLSPQSHYIVGQDVVIDGGLTMGLPR